MAPGTHIEDVWIVGPFPDDTQEAEEFVKAVEEIAPGTFDNIIEHVVNPESMLEQLRAGI